MPPDKYSTPSSGVKDDSRIGWRMPDNEFTGWGLPIVMALAQEPELDLVGELMRSTRLELAEHRFGTGVRPHPSTLGRLVQWLRT